MEKLLLSIALLIVGTHLGAQNSCTFDYEADSIAFKYPQHCVDSILHPGKFSAIIYGEIHVGSFEPVFKINLLRHLNEAYGFRHVFMEVGQSAAWLYNHYLATGDTALFHPLGPGRKSTPPYYSVEYRLKFWPQLYAYNQSLPQDRRIIIHGTDFERKEMLGVLQMLLPPGAVIPQHLVPVFADIRAYAADTSWADFDHDAARRYKHLRQAFAAADEDARVLYGSNYAVAKGILDNKIRQQSNWRPRNHTILAAIRKATATDSISRMIGFFGGAHTDNRQHISIARQVNIMPAFNGRTLNIIAIHYNVPLPDGRTMPYMGFAKKTAAAALYDQYLTKKRRGVLMSTATTCDPSFIKAGDMILLADDTPPGLTHR